MRIQWATAAIAVSISQSVFKHGQVAQADAVLPQAGSQTQVVQTGAEVTITGGTTSFDGKNLFHTFERLGLSQGEIATFLTQPDIESILSSVVGGDASYIDGLLRVSGSDADLYLINPAGILFGPNATLDLPGSFAATTASGLLFDEAVFNVLGEEAVNQFVDAPTGFVFARGATGAIVNGADLSVLPGQAIALIGGQVISTGTLTAPNGEITIAAVSDGDLVRISQSDTLLNLEIATLPEGAVATKPFTPLTLPELLTGGDGGTATGVTVNADGTITLVETAISDQGGTAIVTGELDVGATIAGDVAVVGDRVALVDARVNASGTVNGGTVRIGGDVQGQHGLPGSTLTYVDADSAIAANGEMTADGGTVILWSDGTTGFWGSISANGGPIGGDGGFVEVSGAQSLLFRGTVDTTAPAGQTGHLLLDPIDIVIRNGTADGDDADLLATRLSDPEIAGTDPLPTEIFESELEGLTGDTAITLRASNDIILEDLTDNELSFQQRLPLLGADGNPVTVLPAEIPADPAPIRFEAGRNFVMNANDAIVAPGRDVSIRAGGTVTVGQITTLRDGTAVDPAESLDGSISLTGTTIKAGVLNALQRVNPLGVAVTVDGELVESAITGLGAGNISQVSLTSTTGDVGVEAILAGAGGVVVNSARQFRVEGSFPVRTNLQDGDGSDDEVVTPSIIVAIQDQIFGDAEGGGHPPVLEVIEVPIRIQGGAAIAPNPQPGVLIAVDVQQLSTEDITFTVDPSGLLPAGQSGTLNEILHLRPDRVVITRFENQVFTFEGVALENQPILPPDSANPAAAPVPPATEPPNAPEAVENLSDQEPGETTAASETLNAPEEVLTICEDGEDDEACEDG